MISRQTEDGSCIFEGRLAIDIHRAIAAPQPPKLPAWIIDGDRPTVDVVCPAVQKIRRLLIAVEFRKIGNVMRLVRGDEIGLFTMHTWFFSRVADGCRDFGPPLRESVAIIGDFS
jgi:hypothetical protein